jgi:hypothetical protein
MTHDQKMEVAQSILDRVDNPKPVLTVFNVFGSCLFVIALIVTALTPNGNLLLFILGY